MKKAPQSPAPKEESDPPAKPPSAFELAHLAVMIAAWRGDKEPAFLEAEKTHFDANRYLAGDYSVVSGHEYPKLMEHLFGDERLLWMKSARIAKASTPIGVPCSRCNASGLVGAVHCPTCNGMGKIELPAESAEIAHTLRAGKQHPKMEEPVKFPASWATCMRMITGEKDRNRRAPWLAAAGEYERTGRCSNTDEFRIVAGKMVPHLPRFGATYAKKKAAKPTLGPDGKFKTQAVDRGHGGMVTKIKERGEKGQIRKK